MTHVTGLVAELLENLTDIGRALLAVSKQKSSALAAMNVARIDELTEEEGILAEQFATRRDALRELLAEQSESDSPESREEPAKPFRLMELIEGTPEPARSRLSALRSELKAVMREVEFANMTNGIVSRRSLKHFADMLGLLSGAGRAEERYTAAGRVSRRIGPSRLVNQIA